MDRIEQLMKNAKPHVPEPGANASAMTDRSNVFSADPNLVHLAHHKPKRTAVRATAGGLLAAACVLGAVVLAGNLAPQSAPAPAATSIPSASATPTPSIAPAEPSVSPTPAVISPPAALPAPVAPSTPPVSPDTSDVRTFTFPDGHISFELPAGWTVQTEPGFTPDVGGGEAVFRDDVGAKIYDEAGANVAYIASGFVSGILSGPVNRTILDSAKIDDFDNRDGASYFLYARDDNAVDPSVVSYFMGVVAERVMTEGPGSSSANSFLGMPNGAATAYARLDSPMSPEDANAWMQTVQYSKLKALLTSIRYSE